MENNEIITLTPGNLLKHGLYCLKNPKHPGFKAKSDWYNKYYPKGLRIKILQNNKKELLGFIEYIPIEYTFRPVAGKGYMFIHCLFVYPKKNLNLGNATLLINDCIKEAKKAKMQGVSVATSEGVWMSGKSVFMKNGFTPIESKGRFELLSLNFKKSNDVPSFLNWEDNLKEYRGWNLIYSDQCPYHEKSAIELKELADSLGYKLNIKKITSHAEARKAPTGFGTFSLVYNGTQIEDHYISKTRFRNILDKHT